MRNANIIVLASTNRHKLEEFILLFKKYPDIHIAPADQYIRNAQKLGLVETSDHYYDNVLAKARACNMGCHYPSLADDSGIEVEALGNGPGVHSHRYSTPKAGQTQDQSNIQKMLDQLKNVPEGNRSARFVCHVALVMEGTLIHAIGALEGKIALEPRGSMGFGYDPIFIPHGQPGGQNKTIAELGLDYKLNFSHRALAVENLMEEVQKKKIILAKP